MKVLFLTAWYPTQRDAMAGLFVQKHVDALRLSGADVQVLYSEQKGIAWYQDMAKSWRRLKQSWGLPDFVQVNVLDKNAFLAYYLLRRYGIPFCVIEHWSGYLPSNFSFRGGLHGRLMRFFASRAAAILPVSQALMQAMQRCGIRNDRWHIVHNVVDDFFFAPSTATPPTDNTFSSSTHGENVEIQSVSTPSLTIPQIDIPSSPSPIASDIPSSRKKRLLHVSCFDDRAKNVSGIVRAVKRLSLLRNDFEFVFVGTGVDFVAVKSLADSLDFPNGMLLFTGEQTPQQVCAWMQQSDGFVLFSRYETAGVVLAECLATGLPMIGTDTEAIPETIDAHTGLLVPSEDEAALAAAMNTLLDTYAHYDKSLLRRRGEAYSYRAVSTYLLSLYDQILSSR